MFSHRHEYSDGEPDWSLAIDVDVFDWIPVAARVAHVEGCGRAGRVVAAEAARLAILKAGDF